MTVKAVMIAVQCIPFVCLGIAGVVYRIRAWARPSSHPQKEFTDMEQRIHAICDKYPICNPEPIIEESPLAAVMAFLCCVALLAECVVLASLFQ